MLRTEAVIDLGAIRSNVARLAAATSAQVMAVVKADGYGHGLEASARAALAGGATWLGTATIDEMLQIRAAGITAPPALAWLWTPGEAASVRRAVETNIDLSVSSRWQLHAVATAARALARPARVHLKIDTGLSRNGATEQEWRALAREAGRTEWVHPVGIWSHFAYADEPGHPTIARQIERFRAALAVAQSVGLRPEVRHLANSAATLTLPEAHFDLVRPGIAIYGLSPVAYDDFGLTPAMTLRAALASVKRVRAGEGVSYGHTYITPRETTLALVPLGYADGVPRHASNTGPVCIRGQRFTVSGRVCMDQFVVDVGDLAAEAGDEVVLFGRSDHGVPTAQDWADAVGTIHYEIVTRVGARVPRTYVGGDE